MKVISLGHERNVIVELTAWELECITGVKVYDPDNRWNNDGTKRGAFIGKEFSLSKWDETKKTAEAVKYHAKSAVQDLERIKKDLETTLFPFLDTYQSMQEEK